MRRALGLALLSLAGCTAAREVRVHDLDGRALDPLASPRSRAVVLLFADPECPISNAFAPEVRRIHDEFGPRGVSFYLVYADGDRTVERVKTHAQAFGYPMPVLLDFEHELVERTGATIVPEAAVFTPEGQLVYRGRIDDRYVDFGKLRAQPTVTDLRDALEAVLAGRRPAEPWGRAIGCSIPEVRGRGAR